MNIEAKFAAYNQAWEQGKIEKPAVVLIGGHIGTGKSTFAKLVEERIMYATALPTGIIRAIQKANTTPDVDPYLFLHSYSLGTINPDPDRTYEENTLSGFIKQVEVVEKALLNIIRFSDSEGQQYIMEGNHIMPAFTTKQDSTNNIISLFFQVTDHELYSQMVSGPTHKRILTPAQLSATRYIHDYIARQAEEHKQPLFECHQRDEALKLVAERLEVLLP